MALSSMTGFARSHGASGPYAFEWELKSVNAKGFDLRLRLPPGWDEIPGARGCTPQSCSFRDHFAALKALGVDHVFGLSTQDTDYQREAAERLHLPFALLSDAELKFTRALKLPTFTIVGMTLIKRMVLVIDDGAITKVFYPVFPPDQSASDVLAWLSQQPRS